MSFQDHLNDLDEHLADEALLYGRTQWNSEIGMANDLVEGCQGEGHLLDKAPPNHIWSVADVTAVRNKLSEVCYERPTFTQPLTTWRRSILNELATARTNCKHCKCKQSDAAETREMDGAPSYLLHTYGNARWHKNEWNDGDHWHFQWEYSLDYDYTPSIGYGYGAWGMADVGHTIKFHIEYWLSPYGGSPQLYVEDDDIGVAIADCEGTIVSAPSGTYTRVFPADTPMNETPTVTPMSYWKTSNASCCAGYT